MYSMEAKQQRQHKSVGKTKTNPTHRAETSHSSSSKSLVDFYTLKFTVSCRTEWNPWELVPLINSSAFHQSDTKHNLCSKKPKCSVMERGRRRCITQVVMAGDNFLRDPEKVLCLHRVLKNIYFNNHREAPTIFFCPSGKPCVSLAMYFPYTGMPMRSTADTTRRLLPLPTLADTFQLSFHSSTGGMLT